MEEYPEELRTPPVALACLVGMPELHQLISAFLHAEQPPMNTLALPDFAKVPLLVRRKQKEGEGEAAGGILKREWLLKHRTRVPAVAAAMIGMERVEGDPSQWQQVCTDLDSVRTVLRGRNIKFVVVLVQNSTRDISDDFITAIKKRAEVDSKNILIFAQTNVLEQQQSLNRIAGIFAELSNMHYREEGRRVKARIDKKNLNCIELNIRYCFKAAIYAEFRRDWAEALRFYDEGYRILREMVGISLRLPPNQRLIEIKTVAEHFHFKISTLLLHGGKVGEAVTWFRRHLSSYEKLTGELEVSFLHWEWLSRQFLVFAELMETSSASVPSTVLSRMGTPDNPLTEWELRPAYYYQSSAQYLKKKRESLNYCLSIVDDSELSSTDSIISSEFIGQYVRLYEEGDTSLTIPIVDAEHSRYALSEGKRFQDSIEIIALLRKSLESFNALKSLRMSAYCTNRMAKEHFVLSEFGNSKKLFDSVVGLYRQEGWVTLLWESLGYLRECSRHLNLQKDFIEYSFEMSALPIFTSDGMEVPNAEVACSPAGAPGLLRRQVVQEEVFKLLNSESSLMSGKDDCELKLIKVQLIYLEIDPISPLRSAFLASVAFHEQSVKPGVRTLLTLAILTHLPLPVEIDYLELQFNQSECNIVISSAHKDRSQADASVNERASRFYDGPREDIPSFLALETNKWMRMTCEVRPGQSGKLECLSVILKLGRHLSVCCRAESTASMENLPLWKLEDTKLSFPSKDPALSYSGQKFIQVEEPDPQVDLLLNASSPALVGEIFTIPVVVVSKGHAVHSGELKINIVDAKDGGLMSPREAESFSFDNHDVELLSISGMTEENDSPKDVDSIKKVTQSFGLVSVPFLEAGASWHGKLEMKWHRPKAMMLYVSLGYSPSDSEPPLLKVNVHKSLQIEGKIPIIINHRFMLPFRREPLLLPRVKQDADSGETGSLALNENSILIVSARNCCEVPLRLICMSIEQDVLESASTSVVPCAGGGQEVALLLPGVEFKQVFSIIPRVESPKAVLGCISVEWRRNSMLEQQSDCCVISKQKLPDMRVERPPLIVSWECPPHAVVGIPFMVYVKLQNMTSFLQDIKFSLGDSQSFVFCGSHNDSASILPKSEHIIPYKLVPLFSGHQQLPQFALTSVRYSAGFHPSAASSTIFIFPSEPNFNKKGDDTSEQTASAVDVA